MLYSITVRMDCADAWQALVASRSPIDHINLKFWEQQAVLVMRAPLRLKSSLNADVVAVERSSEEPSGRLQRHRAG